MWWPVTRYDARAATLADRHYSRRSRGSRQFMPPGRYVAFLEQGPLGFAVWTAVLNLYRDELRWRNTLYRNESGLLSSELVAWATLATYCEWLRVHGTLPSVPLRTEVHVEATSARRSARHEPGHCYRMAGWREVARVRRAKRKETRVVLEAPAFVAILWVLASWEVTS